MSGFNLHFNKGPEVYDADFVELAQATGESVCVGGREYEIKGESKKIRYIREKLQLSSESISKGALEERVLKLGATDLSVSDFDDRA